MTPSQRLAIYVRDLLQQPEGSVVQVGRDNMKRDDFNALQIVIDQISPAVLESSSNSYDSDTEEQSFYSTFKTPMTIDFFGDIGYTEAVKFTALKNSQRGYELQRDSGLTVYNVGQITDVKLLAGSEYSGRFQIELHIKYTETTTIETLCINSASGTILTEDGEITTWQASTTS